MDEDSVKNGFVFYRSFLEIVLMFPKKDQGRMLRAVIELGLNGMIDENLPLAMKTALHQMQATFIATEKRREINSKNGKKGGAPKGNQNAKRKNGQKQPKTTENNPETTENNLKDKENRKGNIKDNTFSIRKGNETSSGMAPLEEGQPSDDDKYPWEN